MTTNENSKLLRQLLDIGRQMAETRALEPLLVYAVDVTLELLNAQYGFLVLLDGNGGLDFPVARDRQGNNIDEPETQISKTIIYRVINDMKHQRIASATGDEQFGNARSVKDLSLRSVLCVPLISRGTAIGVIYLENRQEYDLFTEDDVEPLQYLAGHAAVCIQNAILNEQLEHQVLRMDEITQLVMSGEVPSDVLENALEKERGHILYSFIRDASHQFRTPLAVIKTSVDLLKRKIDTTRFGNYLDRIAGQVNTIVSLVESLNFLAKLESDVDRDFVREDMRLLLRDMWEVMSQRAEIKKVEIRYSVPDYPVHLAIIPNYARQALSQVVENAITYTDSGGTITLDLLENDESVQLIISDTGQGITEEDLSQVLERFFRGDKAGTTRGLGLGLSIADSIMRIHGGEITIKSIVDEGTKVFLTFPKIRHSE